MIANLLFFFCTLFCVNVCVLHFQDNANTVLYSGLLDEFVEVLEINDPKLSEIKGATLRTLTSIIHLERMPSFPK